MMSSVTVLAGEPLTSRTFTLEKPFEVIVPIVQLNNKLLTEQLGGKVVSKKFQKVALDFDLSNQNYSITFFRSKVINLKLPGKDSTTIRCNERTILRNDKIETTTVLAEENEHIQYTKSVVTISKKDDKTEVELKMWVQLKDKNVRSFWIRIFSNIKMKNFEETLRDVTNCPEPDDPFLEEEVEESEDSPKTEADAKQGEDDKKDN